MPRLPVLAATLLILAVGSTSCRDEEEEKAVNDEVEKYTGDSYGELRSPYIHYSGALPYQHETTWVCVSFGSYPQAEVLPEATSAVDDYALDDDNVLIDPSLYSQLQSAEWGDNETTLQGCRYRRLSAADAVSWATDRRGHYRWGNDEEYHYFKYQPVKWRILNISGDTALLLADRALDCHKFHATETEVSWATCDYRQWLNSEVYDALFSDVEKQSVRLSEVHNAANYYFGTTCGADTQDYLFILSEEEVFCSDKAYDYGFLNTDGLDDPARRFRPTMYAKCRGSWISPVESYKGNTFWFMRSSGYTPFNVTYVCEFGYLYNRGTIVTCDDSGVIPAVRVDLSTANLQRLGTVSSDDIIQ